MRHALAVCLLLLAQVNITFAYTPAYTIGGCYDNWMLGLPRDQYLRLTEPHQVPAHTSVTVELRHDVAYTRPEVLYGGMLYGASLKRRFVLINVETAINQAIGVDQTQYRTWPHLGLLYVGTVAHQEGWEVVLWDELVQGYAPLDQLIEPGDIVGLSIVVTGVDRSVELAHQAKAMGARYVIGGNDSAIFRASHFLQLPGQPFDAIFTGGDLPPIRAFFQQVNQIAPAAMNIRGMQTDPNLVERTNDEATALMELKLQRTLSPDDKDFFIVPEFSLYPQSYWQEVWQNYRRTFGHKHRVEPTNALALFAQGCTRAASGQVCEYCTIADVRTVQFLSAGRLERMVRAYHDFGIDTVFNTTDSIYEMGGVAKLLRSLKMPFNAMTIYGRAWGLANHPELLDVWRECVNDRLLINVGMDSGSEEILSRGIHKAPGTRGSRLAENYRALEVIKAGGAHLHYSLIFGSPGETLESCERSIEFLEHSVQTLGPQLDLVETDVFWLNFGSPASRVFTDYAYARELATKAGRDLTALDWQRSFAQYRDELVVPDEVEQSWYQYFTAIDFDTAQVYNERAASIMAAHTGSIRGRAYKPVS